MAEIFGDPVQVTSAAQSLTVMLGYSVPLEYGAVILIRALPENAGRVWISRPARPGENPKAEYHTIGFLDSGEAYGADAHGLSTDDFYLYGTHPGDGVTVSIIT